MVNIPPELDTLPKEFLARVRQYGNRKIALRQKELGIWQEFTWQDSYENTRDLCLGLVSLGIAHGDRVCVVGDNDRQYLWADLAMMAAGAVTVGMFTDAAPSEMEFVINHSGAVLVFAKDQEQCDKLLEIRERIPGVKKVIYWDGRGMWSYQDPWLMSFEAVQAQGHKLAEEKPDHFEKLIAAGKGEDLANICYTSGTTGQPKGVMLTHMNFLSAAAISSTAEPRWDTDNLVSFTPLAWIAEHTLCVTPHCMHGIIINFPESPETVQQNIREIAPNWMFYPARLWENITGIIQVRISDSTWLNRLLYRIFLPIGYKVADLHYDKKPVPLPLRVLHWLGDRLVFEPLRSQMGLHRVRTALTAGASLGPDMMRYFYALGLNLKQVFATTETTGVGTQHFEGDIQSGTVGKPCEGIQVKISPEGEILMGGANIFHGYFKNEEATNKALTVDEHGVRWFHTGDAGYIDDQQHVVYLDRVKDLIELAGGEKYSPQYIEGRLKFSPYVKDVMSLGGKDLTYVTALIAIDFENVGRWAEKNRITYTTFVDLSQKPEVYKLIRRDIEQVNMHLPPAARVRKFVLLHKEFDADEAEMTRTRKLRRGFLHERYSEMIDSIYNDRESVKVSAAVSYRDGRQGVIETAVRIMSLDERMPA